MKPTQICSVAVLALSAFTQAMPTTIPYARDTDESATIAVNANQGQIVEAVIENEKRDPAHFTVHSYPDRPCSWDSQSFKCRRAKKDKRDLAAADIDKREPARLRYFSNPCGSQSGQCW